MTRQEEYDSLEKIKEYAKPYYRERFYHNWTHIEKGLSFIDSLYGSYQLSEDMERKYFLLRIAFVFHDIIYDIKSKTNEIDSVDLMKKYFYKNKIINADEIELVEKYIMATLHHDNNGSEKDSLINLMIEADIQDVLYGNLSGLLTWESKIIKEFNKFPLQTYIKGRVGFLVTHGKWNPKRLIELCTYVQSKTYSICYCTARVNDFSSIEKLLSLFDKVILVNQESKFLECVEEIPSIEELKKIYKLISFKVMYLDEKNLLSILELLEDAYEYSELD